MRPQTTAKIYLKFSRESGGREALFDKLNGLQKEVDRDRTRFDAYAALAVEAAGVLGDSVEKSKVLDVLNTIARVMCGTKKDQETKRLPPASPPKRLEAPRSQKSNKQKELDDEIPF